MPVLISLVLLGITLLALFGREPPRYPTATTERPHITAPSVSGAVIDNKETCVYASDHLSLLAKFDELVGRDVNCVQVYNDSASDWAAWERPWFLDASGDLDWAGWAATPGTHRQLIITQDLFPIMRGESELLRSGAAGRFEAHAQNLAANLVRAGLGNSIIRLAPEANGNWDEDSIPDTPAGDAEWVSAWRNTALAMKSVAGAHFKFDWTVNPRFRDIPLDDYYPGNDVVDIVGVDLYDAADPSQQNRWNFLSGGPMGFRAIDQFATSHGKPLSIPEWGVIPQIAPDADGGGDDAGYVRGLADFVATGNVAYQCYFFSSLELAQLENGPRSLALYRSAFGARGFAANARDFTEPTIAPTEPPTLTVTGGPPFGGTIYSGDATFTFTSNLRSGETLACSVDSGEWGPCTSSSRDQLTRLVPGYHDFSVQLSDAANQVALSSTPFLVS